MPATAGRIRMPANNRLSVSDSLKTTEIWQKSVGYDPYAPNSDRGNEGSADSGRQRGADLFTLARLAGQSTLRTPGGCKRCGQVGHLTHQCRNNSIVKVKKGEWEKQRDFTPVLQADDYEEGSRARESGRVRRHHHHHDHHRHHRHCRHEHHRRHHHCKGTCSRALSEKRKHKLE